MWQLKPRHQPRLVAGWHGWHLYETVPGHYDATDGRRRFPIEGPLDAVLVRFCDRVKGGRWAEAGAVPGSRRGPGDPADRHGGGTTMWIARPRQIALPALGRAAYVVFPLAVFVACADPTKLLLR